MRRFLLGTACALVFVVLAASCSSRPEPYMGSPSRGQMLTHFDLALEARGHAIGGDLERFRDVMEDLADLEPADDLGADIILQLGPMRWEAREGALAENTAEAAVASAKLARTCGDCHVANDVPLGERFTIGGPPPAGTTQRHMGGLAWASRLLWDGLVGPSDETWFTGSEGLMELGSLPEGIRPLLPPGDFDVAGARLRQLGERGTLARDGDMRVEVLSEVWGVCADCHIRLR